MDGNATITCQAAGRGCRGNPVDIPLNRTHVALRRDHSSEAIVRNDLADQIATTNDLPGNCAGGMDASHGGYGRIHARIHARIQEQLAEIGGDGSMRPVDGVDPDPGGLNQARDAGLLHVQCTENARGREIVQAV